MLNDQVLFVAHKGIILNKEVALLLTGSCLPIAFSHTSMSQNKVKEEDRIPFAAVGLHALFESDKNIEVFFDELQLYPGLFGIPPQGLFVYEVCYDEYDGDGVAFYDWDHLTKGGCRRPTVGELKFIAEGKAPWNGLLL